jgi:thiamine biosynthesis lipoprotein
VGVRRTVLIFASVLVVSAAVATAADDDLLVSPDGPEAVRVYFTPAEALAKAFDRPDTLWAEPWRPEPAARADLEALLGWRIEEPEFVFHRARRDGKDLGWALVLEEKGRFKPITFLVHVEPDHRVGLVLVMVYRESRGDGVKRQRFLKQFRGRDATDPMRLNRDVIGVSGATLSSRALAAGVRKALLLTEARYGGLP